MKLYAVTAANVDPKLKAIWNQYAQRMGAGDKPKVKVRMSRTKVTSKRPENGAYRRWKPKRG